MNRRVRERRCATWQGCNHREGSGGGTVGERVRERKRKVNKKKKKSSVWR